MNSFNNPFDTPQQMVKELAGMPLTVLFALFVTDPEQLPISEVNLAKAVNRGRNSVSRHLHGLQQRGLIFRTKRYGGWDLTPSAKQIQFGFMLQEQVQIESGRRNDALLSTETTHQKSDTTHQKSDTTHQKSASIQVTNRESEVIHSEEDSIHRENGGLAVDNVLKPTLSYIQDRKIDRKIGIDIESTVNNFCPHPVSVAMLRRLGIKGDLDAMGSLLPSELIAAWWQCQWGKSPRSVLARHLLDRRPIDPLYVELAMWRMLATATEVAALITLILHDRQTAVERLPEGVSLAMYDVAVNVYADMDYLPMWCD